MSRTATLDMHSTRTCRSLLHQVTAVQERAQQLDIAPGHSSARDKEPGVLSMCAGSASSDGGRQGGGVQPWIIAVAVVGAVLVAAVAVLAFFVARRRRHPPYHDGPKVASDVRRAPVLLPQVALSALAQLPGCQSLAHNRP